MSFLSPNILWALIFAFIPLIIHIFNKLTTKTINFSSIQFLKKLETSKIKFFKIKELVLLLLRTLIIIFLVLAFSRPVISGYFTITGSSNQSSHIAIIIDNSASMSYEDNQISFFDKSKNNAYELLTKLNNNFFLDVYQTTPFKRVASERIINQKRIMEILNKISISGGKDNIYDVINSSLKSSDKLNKVFGDIPNKELYIFSDFPASILKNEKIDLMGWRTYLFMMDEFKKNIRINEAKVNNLIKYPNQLLSIETNISNSSSLEIKDLEVELFANDIKSGQLVSNLKPNIKKNFEFKVYSGQNNISNGWFKIPNDDFDLDNKKFFQFRLTKKIKILFFHNENEFSGPIKYVFSSINHSNDYLEIENYSYNSFGYNRMSDKDLIIFYNPIDFNDEQISLIRNYQKSEKSFLIFLGDSNTNLFSDLNYETSFNDNGDDFFSLNTINFENPIFKNFPIKNLIDEMPKIKKYNPILNMSDYTKLLNLSNGDPFLFEINQNGNKSIVFTSLMNLDWSDLPINGIFIPLIHRIIVYLSNFNLQEFKVDMGDSLFIPLSRANLSKEIILEDPNGLKSKLKPDFENERLILSDLNLLGIYKIFVDTKFHTSFITHLSELENPSKRISKNALSKVFQLNNVKIVNFDENHIQSVDETRKGKELWYFFIIISLILIIFESFYSRSKSI
tara:strand:+ start:17682 stop:19718 length:2037 start_codon:yes stop_codon:yes gene_type:complete